MVFRQMIFLAMVCLLPMPGRAEGPVKLYAPTALVDTGLFRYILPRFSLKTRVRVDLVDDPGAAQIVLGDDGTALFQGAGTVWHLNRPGAGAADADRFADWLRSEVGLNTITSFAPDGTALFHPPPEPAPEDVAVVIEGDAVLGLEVSRRACARCHAVEQAGRKTDIASSPSFYVLRGFDDWQQRFAGFYALNPHPAFTQVEDITDPFPIDRPSPIHPVTMTLDEIEAMIAYVAGLTPADLGAPLQAQEF
ncbi:MAG: hypothetical protein CML66_30740 [Rhodobacteraceae bacterium]|nr:hypothetical protein [Paracoccaceae bacterium]